MSKKIALISGASRGIGKEIAIALAQDNYISVITYISSPDKANDVVQQIQKSGGEALTFKADVSNEAEVDSLFQQIQDKFGKIDVVINTAGISILKPLSELSTSDFNKVMNTNLMGTFHILQKSVKYLSKGGRILTFSSNVTDTLPANYSIYAASKAAVETMSKILSKELRGREITVNVISPGPTGTDMFLEGKSPELVQQFAQLSPFERLGKPEDIINVVKFLLQPEAVWINGQVIKVNGGSN